mgnify:CR=1 FL=1
MGMESCDVGGRGRGGFQRPGVAKDVALNQPPSFAPPSLRIILAALPTHLTAAAPDVYCCC